MLSEAKTWDMLYWTAGKMPLDIDWNKCMGFQTAVWGCVFVVGYYSHDIYVGMVVDIFCLTTCMEGSMVFQKFQILHFFTQKKQIFCLPTGPVPGFPNISCTVRCVEYFIWILVYEYFSDVWHFLWLLVYWTVCLPLLHCPMDSHIIYLYCRYYSATIITMAGVRSTRTAIWLSALTNSVNFLFTMVGVYLVEKMGRRPLTLLSLLGEFNHR